jgi:hypothetical protein
MMHIYAFGRDLADAVGLQPVSTYNVIVRLRVHGTRDLGLDRPV